MKIGIMQGYFFPYLGYFSLIDAVDKFMLYEYVTYRKRAWINRNRLLNKGSGKPFHITVPVKATHTSTLIQDVRISDTHDWKRILLNQIYFNYAKAPFFEYVYHDIEILMGDFVSASLHELNAFIIRSIANKLKINTPITYRHAQYESVESKIMNDTTSDLPVMVKRIAAICDEEGAGCYVNPSGGRDLYTQDTFKKLGLELRFLIPDHHAYCQFNKFEVSNLSIIDFLMHNGWDETSKAVKKYQLVK